MSNASSREVTPEQIAEAAGRAWSNNDKEAFISLFNTDAVVHHPMFPEPVGPVEVADVVDKGRYKLAHVQPEGDGIFMVFDQAEVGDKVSAVGAVPILAKIKDNKFSEFRVGDFFTRGKTEPLRADAVRKAQKW